MKKGYRLTPEEEAIVRGEIPQETGRDEDFDRPSAENAAGSAAGNGEKKPGSGRAVGSILPVLFALALMVGIAYFFLWLIHTPERRAEQAARESGAEETLSAEPLTTPQQQLFREQLRLTVEEEAAFWPVYSRFCREMASAWESHSERLIEHTLEQEDTFDYAAFVSSYSAVFKELEKITLRFCEAFSALLGEERTPLVMLLYERWHGPNRASTP